MTGQLRVLAIGDGETYKFLMTMVLDEDRHIRIVKDGMECSLNLHS